MFPGSDWSLGFIILAVRFHWVFCLVFVGHGQRELCQSFRWKTRRDVFFQVHGHEVRFVHFSMFVPVLPFGVQTIDQLKGPFEIFSRGAAPNRNGMVLVRLSINVGVQPRFQHVQGRAQHLYGFQQDFTYVFVYHRLRDFLVDKRKYEEVHCHIIEMVCLVIPFQFYMK